MSSPTSLRELKKHLNQNHITFAEDCPASQLTSVGIGERIALVVNPQTEEQLLTLARWLKHCELPAWVHGQGTNCFFNLPQDPYPGVLIQWTPPTEELPPLQTLNADAVFLTLHTGVRKSTLSRYCLNHHLSDAIWLCGIPGTLGGGIAMNAGTRHGDFEKITYRVSRVDLKKEVTEILKPHPTEFSYRSQSFCYPHQLLTSVTLKLKKAPDPDRFKKQFQTTLTYRKQTQPLQERSFGSTFKNPPGTPAAILIQKVGLKGTQRGDALIHSKHANFFVNCGHASGQDMRSLILYTQERVYRQTGIQLSPEVQMISSFPHLS